MKKYKIDFQLDPPHMHRQNLVEREIRTCKNHFISGLSTTDSYLPISEWDQLLYQFMITLNLLCNSRVNPTLFLYTYRFGPYDFNKSPMAPPVTRVVVHYKPGNRTSWDHHDTKGWYIGISLDHYRCMQCYMPATGIVRITDTLLYTPKTFDYPKIATEDYLQQAIVDIIATTKDPPKTLPFMSYGDVTKITTNQISRTLQRSKSQPYLQNFPLPPMLPQIQNENIQHQKIISTPAPAPRVKLVSQPPRLQTKESVPTLPPIDNPSTLPRLDPHSNPWIKILQNIRKHPRLSNPENYK